MILPLRLQLAFHRRCALQVLDLSLQLRAANALRFKRHAGYSLEEFEQALNELQKRLVGETQHQLKAESETDILSELLGGLVTEEMPTEPDTTRCNIPVGNLGVPEPTDAEFIKLLLGSAF